MDFVAIDFETANGNANSACQLAAVTVENSEIIHEQSWMIRPPRMYFAPRNIAIHGIHPSQVRDADTMVGIWPEFERILNGKTAIAHNARFDIGVLVQSLAAYEFDCPNIDFSCTRAIARGVWPGKARYGLKPLGTWLGINFQHHDALEDARCCASIALAAAEAAAQPSLEQLEKAMRISRGTYINGTITSPRLLGRNRGKQDGGGRQSTDRWGFPSSSARRTAARVDPESILNASTQDLPLAGKIVCLLAPLRGLDQSQSENLISQLGGTSVGIVTHQTTYVVACGMSLADASQQVCRSLAEAEEQSCDGQSPGVRILSERQFRALLPGGKAIL